jgi:hypothetical protein
VTRFTRGHRAGRNVLLSLTVLALTGVGSACRGVMQASGGDPATARANADAFASAIEQRFTNVVRAPKFAHARLRLGRYAFAPSKLVNDSALWTSTRSTRVGVERDLELHASLVDGRYTFLAKPRVPSPVKTGDMRHVIRLASLGADDWRWSTEVDHAIGALQPPRLDDIARALFASAERTPMAVRADYRSVFPRTAQALGRLFTVDSINTAAQPDGSTLVSLHVLTETGGLREGFPAFAKYVDKYIAPARYRFRLTDRGGTEWFDAQGASSRLTIRFRSRNGALQPIAGPARAMPDSLLIHVDALAKISFWTVGVTSMQGDFVHVDTPSERGWSMRFTKDPKWHLPLIAERLLRTPLERPFQGSGATFRMYVRTGPDGVSLLGRTFELAVRESAIMRFLGNLGFTAMSDFAGTVEDQENRFIAEAFRAMRADLKAQ